MADFKLKIALIIDALDIGGAEMVLLYIANELFAQNYKVHFIATRHGGVLTEKLKEGIEIHIINKGNGFDFKAAKKLRDIIYNNGIDIIHSHSHTTSYFVTLSFLGRTRKFKHILHSHYGPVINDKKVRLLDRFLLRSVNYYIASSDLIYSYFINHLGIKETICKRIYNGIEFPADIIKEQRKCLEKIKILQIANFSRNKNHLFSLQICKSLKNKGFDFIWIFVGNYSKNIDYYNELNNYIINNSLHEFVQFKGELSNVWPVIFSSDLGILTSLHESMPLSAIEYIYGQLPCVFPPQGHLLYLAEIFNTCFVIDKYYPELFADKIIEIIQNIESLKPSLIENSERVKELYGINQMIKEIELVYSSVSDL